MSKLTLTQKKILEQLQENTGRHLLDSGGAYGRNWERNQKKTWEELTQPEVVTTADVWNNRIQLGGMIKLGAFMDAMLEYSPNLQRRYDNFVVDSEESHMNDMLDFLEKSRLSHEYSNENRGGKYDVHYTYNWENDLTQDIQFVEFKWEVDEEWYVLLQVHGGCDARGGLTAPRVYKLRDRDYFSMGMTIADHMAYPNDEQWEWSDSGDDQDRNGRAELKDTPAVEWDGTGDFDEFCKEHPEHFVCVSYTDDAVWYVDDAGIPWKVEAYAHLQF